MIDFVLANCSSALEVVIFRFLLQSRQKGVSGEVEASLQIRMGQRVAKSWPLKKLRG